MNIYSMKSIYSLSSFALSALLVLIFQVMLTAQCEHPDYRGLMELYEATGGDNWTNNDGWLQGSKGQSCDPCNYINSESNTWYGVNCINGRVSSLDLSNNDNTFNLPGNNLVGELPDLDLKFLQILFLSNNQLSGPFPELTKVPQLWSLVASRNEFSGQLPTFSNLKKLRRLDLSFNNIGGTLPDIELPVLDKLLLYSNQIGGEIPVDWDLPLVQRIELDRNLLVGDVPDFPNSPKVEKLNVSNNLLNGVIQEPKSLTRLIEYNCGFNALTGSLPRLQHNKYIRDFFAPRNRLTGQVPELLEHNGLRNYSVDLNDLSGCYPSNVCDGAITFRFFANGKMSYGGDNRQFCVNQVVEEVEPFCRSDDGLAGIFSPQTCECEKLQCALPENYQYLMDFYNSTGGDNWTINYGWRDAWNGRHCDPCNYQGITWYGVICSSGHVVCIDLDGDANCNATGFTGNNLTGEVTPFTGQFLREIRLENNELTGSLPSFSDVPRLEIFHFSFNNLTGSLPSFEKNFTLKEIRGSFNNLTGRIPDNSILRGLRVLTLAENNLEACYPDYICDIANVDFTNNYLLPWSGDHLPFCAGEDQLIAPCNSVSGGTYAFNDECECVMTTSTSDPLEHELDIYPNPVQNQLRILNLKSPQDFKIFNSEGRMVDSDQISINESINVSQYNSGIYFIKIVNEQGQHLIRKFVKE